MNQNMIDKIEVRQISLLRLLGTKQKLWSCCFFRLMTLATLILSECFLFP